MDSIINIFQTYQEIWKISLTAVIAVIVFALLAGILRQIKRLNTSLKSITTNMQTYFDVILTEEPEADGEKNPEQTEEQNGEQGKELQVNLENLKKKEEEEKLFNAILQEYFS